MPRRPRSRPYAVRRTPHRGRALTVVAMTAGCLLALSPPGRTAEFTVPELAAPRFEPCQLRGSGGQGRVTAECARVSVPENPEAADGRRIDLFVARIGALTPEPAADAVTLVNGGPGGSSVSLYVDMEQAFSGLRRERDIVLVDQRGTGRSAPFECPTLEAASHEFALDEIREATRACLASFDRDPRFYSTSLAVTDLEALRRALGYQSWNLYGVSYGTRVVQHYLQRYPDAVRTLIIDGVLPMGLPLGPDIALFAQRTLDAIIDRCAEEPYCAEAFPDTGTRLEELSARLRRQPVTLDVPHPLTGRTEPLTLHYAHLAMSLRMLSYSPETAAMIPLIVDEAAARRNYQPLAAQAMLIEKSLLDSISYGMHNSVVCTEDVPFYDDLEATRPRLEATYMGTNQVQALQTICELWPRGPLHPALRQPVTSDTPVLLLSGELDPVTPPEYAERAARSYGSSRHLVAEGQGHGVAPRGCAPELIIDFITTGALQDLDAGCLDRLRDDAFFVDLMGPPP